MFVQDIGKCARKTKATYANPSEMAPKNQQKH
jgi:hypothetical protein